ncbi:MAG TPA: hypothetical protein VH575_07020 [Gemmataceae bacterium]|jgi:hypothetical protein
MDDADFDDLLDQYLDGTLAPNLEMANVEIVWVDKNPHFGSLHMLREHGVEKHEVEEVLLELPPEVEAKRAKDNLRKTYFWGATREGRWLFVACEDRQQGDTRFLTPITAFEPDDGYEYWRRL